MTLRARNRLRIKTPSGDIRAFNPGDEFTAKNIDGLIGLLEAGRIVPAGPCPICKTYDYWLSIHGALVCNVCHPAIAKAVKLRMIERDSRVFVVLKSDDFEQSETGQNRMREHTA